MAAELCNKNNFILVFVLDTFYLLDFDFEESLGQVNCTEINVVTSTHSS